LTDRERARLRIVQEYLMQEHEEITLEAVARHAGMSESAIQRLFRAAHGMSVFEYARAQRLEQARQQLEQCKVSVTEAAFMAGYSSPANFATAFKRQYGVSPREVRRKR
jgi:AraC-like DNA-binding protein